MLVDEQINDLNSFINLGEKGSDSIVFQIGSHSIKFGLASQLIPFVIPTCIAYKKINLNEMIVDSEIENSKNKNYEINDTFLSNLLNIEQDVIKKQLKLEQKIKGKKITIGGSKSYTTKNYENSDQEFPERKNFEHAPSFTANIRKAQVMAFDLNEDIPDNNYKWTSIKTDPSYLVGREALTINEIDKYLIRYPIKYGMFNNEYPYQAILDDLNKIIQFCVSNVIQINKKEYSNYSIVLVIPDLFIKQQVKGIVNIFLRDLNFKSIFLHTESVMSSFGGALQSCCVVDIGSSKINVCCVDEGMMIEESLIRKNYGGDDITKLLYMMLCRKNVNTQKPILPIENFNINNPYHYRIVEKIKETECELPSIQNPSSQFLPKNTKVWLHRKNKNTKLYSITVTEPIYVPPLSLFYTEIFECCRNVTIPYLDYYNDIYSELYSDPEDIMPDLIKTLLTSETTKKEENLIGLNSSIKKSKPGDDDDSASVSRSDENSSQIYDDKNTTGKKNTYENMFKLLSIDDMICQSIMSVSSPELRKKLSNAILLVGGTVKFKGLIDFLEDRLIEKLTQLDNEIERIEIINFPSVDAKTLTWIGGTIIPKLESSKDMWINRDRWLFDLEKSDDNRQNEKELEKNLNDNESKKDTDTVIGASKNEKTANEKNKKKEKHLDSGVNLIREKSAFQW